MYNEAKLWKKGRKYIHKHSSPSELVGTWQACWTRLPCGQVILYIWVNERFQAWRRFPWQKNTRYLLGTWHQRVPPRRQYPGEAVCLGCSSLKLSASCSAV